MIKLAVFFNEGRLAGRLTRFFTGCYAYHVGWVDEERGLLYDMHLIRRRRPWPRFVDSQVLLFDVPEVSREHLEARLTYDDAVYGAIDYLLFAVRPLFHLFGRSTRNAGGVICSEMVNNDLRTRGVATPWGPDDAVPSPCDLYRWALEHRRAA